MDNRQPTLQDGNPRDPRSTATIVLPSGQVVQGQPINDRIPIPEGYTDQLQAQRDLSSGQRTTAPQADTAEGIAAAQAIINARPDTLDTTQVITEPAPQVEFAQENPTGPAQSGPDYERPSEAYLRDIARQVVDLESRGQPIPTELREQLSSVAQSAEAWEAILNEARNQASGTNASGNYTEQQSATQGLLVDNEAALQQMETAAANAEMAEIDRSLTRTEAQRATELEAEARALAAQANPEHVDDRAALESTANATAQNQDLEADANFADAEQTGQNTTADVRDLWARNRAELAGMNTGADPVYQASKTEYDRLFNEYLQRSRINPLRGIGAALQAAGGFRLSTSDRGTLEAGYDTNALNAANQLGTEEQSMRNAAAKATQDALIKTRQDTDAARIRMLENETQNLSDIQAQFAQPIINSLAAAGQLNEAQQAKALQATLDYQQYLANSEIDLETKKQLETYLQADLPLIIMGRVNEIDPSHLELYANNKEKMNMGEFARYLANSGIVINGVNAAGNVIDAFIPDSVFADGGTLPGNPNNEDVPDTVPALLAEGEFVVSNPDVKKIRNGMGKEVLQKIAMSYQPINQDNKSSSNNKSIKKYSRGGDVALGAGGGALSGAATGASIGSAFGPIGTLIGGGIGGIAGGITGGFSADANSKQKSKDSINNRLASLQNSASRPKWMK